MTNTSTTHYKESKLQMFNVFLLFDSVNKVELWGQVICLCSLRGTMQLFFALFVMAPVPAFLFRES